MMKPFEKKLVLTGLSTILVGAILGLLAVLLLGELQPLENPSVWAEFVSSRKYLTSYYILAYAYLIPIIGFWAIHRLFSSDKTTYLLSFWGMILSILGSALPMASMGISMFAIPAFARMFISHGFDVVILTEGVFTTGNIIFMLFSGLYYLIGIILFGIVLWKSQSPSMKTASILLILHGILIILPEQIIINALSWIFLLISSALLIGFARKNIRIEADPHD